jgi:class 3 adenylate cyclase
VERRLAAVLAPDVAGHSLLMGADEVGTLAAVKTYRREIAEPTIVAHRGRIIKTTGDGMLVEFPSIVEAVKCAVEVQRGMAVRNAAIASDRPVEFRMGINIGDVIEDAGDVFGDGCEFRPRLGARSRHAK